MLHREVLPCRHHSIRIPLGEAILQGIPHPCMPTTIHSLWYGQPSSLSSAHLWPRVKLLLDEQSEHCSFTQTFWAELVLMGFTLKFIIPKEILKHPSSNNQSWNLLLSVHKRRHKQLEKFSRTSHYALEVTVSGLEKTGKTEKDIKKGATSIDYKNKHTQNIPIDKASTYNLNCPKFTAKSHIC